MSDAIPRAKKTQNGHIVGVIPAHINIYPSLYLSLCICIDIYVIYVYIYTHILYIVIILVARNIYLATCRVHIWAHLSCT